MGRLDEKTVLVTGGSRGIGAGIAKVLAGEGAKLAITYSSSKESAEKVLSELQGDGHLLVQMNVSDADSIDAGMKQVFEAFGGLDALVNNAGITKDQLMLRMKAEDFDAVINTNLKGTFLCTKAVLKPMMKAKKGSIVNISSVIGATGNAGQANYAASKSGIEAFSRSVALEFGSRNLRVNCVAPGFIQTEMTEVLTDEQKQGILDKVPLQKLGDVNDVAQAVSFLISDDSAYITGQTFHVNGGLFMSH